MHTSSTFGKSSFIFFSCQKEILDPGKPKKKKKKKKAKIKMNSRRPNCIHK